MNTDDPTQKAFADLKRINALPEPQRSVALDAARRRRR
jgi:hypothetical protein